MQTSNRQCSGTKREREGSLRCCTQILNDGRVGGKPEKGRTGNEQKKGTWLSFLPDVCNMTRWARPMSSLRIVGDDGVWLLSVFKWFLIKNVNCWTVRFLHSMMSRWDICETIWHFFTALTHITKKIWKITVGVPAKLRCCGEDFNRVIRGF